LDKLNRSSEDHKRDHDQTGSAAVEAKGKAVGRKDYEMFHIMGRAGFRPQPGEQRTAPE
jgi:hypothetical protein